MGLFPSERPVNADQQERTLLKGVFSVRKGKSQLHKWAERQVILCGTCLIVASVKDSLTGKMHILPLVGGKVRVQCSEAILPEGVFCLSLSPLYTSHSSVDALQQLHRISYTDDTTLHMQSVSLRAMHLTCVFCRA